MTGDGRHLQIGNLGDVTVIAFLDRQITDEDLIDSICQQVFHLVDGEGRRKLVLDFGNVEHVSSAFLGFLTSLHRKMRELSGRVSICNLTPDIYKIFEITNLNRIFHIFNDQESALSLFGED